MFKNNNKKDPKGAAGAALLRGETSLPQTDEDEAKQNSKKI